MKLRIIWIFTTLLILLSCESGLSDNDTYINIPALYGSNTSTGTIKAVLTGSFYAGNEATGLVSPMGIAFDEEEGILFWTEQGASKSIVRYDIKSKEQRVIHTGLSTPEGIDFDPVKREIYWCDSESKTINRSSEWGGSIEELLNSAYGLNKPIRIALDTENRTIYFTDSIESQVKRCDMNGTVVTDVISTSTNPYEIIYHHGQNKIYWNDQGTDEIWRSDRDGTNKEQLIGDVINPSMTDPKGLAIDEDEGILYYTYNDGTDDILRRYFLESEEDEFVSTIGDIASITFGFTQIEQNNVLNSPDIPLINF